MKPSTFSAPYAEALLKSPTKKKQMTKTASSRDLLHKYNHRNKGKAPSLTSSTASSNGKASEKCFLKVHGIGDAPFLMELVAYDTIKTVRNLLANVLKSEFIRNNTLDQADFKLFTGFPRRILNDDSKSLGDLGLVPNGVLHLVRFN